MGTSGQNGAPGLRGRRGECEALDRLLDEVRARQSRVLVMRGEAGVGKTAMLDYLEARSSGCRVVRAAGVEPEMELAFASVHQLCAPMLDRLERLPDPQRDAVRTALGLSTGETPDRFLLGLAVLRLLSDVAEEQPLVCIVDDAQWVDRASLQILTFVARRLLAGSIGLVFTMRVPGDGSALASLPRVDIGGLDDADARALLDAAIPGRLDERVRDRIVAESRGNPLALLEHVSTATAGELAGGFALPNPAALTSRMEQDFIERLKLLPADTRRLLLTAAADPTGDTTLLWRAAERLGIDASAATPAETAGLVELGVRVRFPHPLVRSAAYLAAALPARQEVHRALAEASDPDVDPDRRAWHRAQAVVGHDEAVAAELERSAGRAQSRGGIAARAAFLARAAELTSDPTLRSARALAATQAELDAGAPERACELLSTVEIGPLDELQRARSARLRARVAFARQRGVDAPSLLLDAAKELERLDTAMARDTYLEALGAAIFVGRLGGGLREAAEAARAAPPAPRPPRATDLLLDGIAVRFIDGYVAGLAPLRRALHAFRQQARCGGYDVAQWLWLACPVVPEPLAPDLWDDESWYYLAVNAVRLARDAGALAVLPMALSCRASVHVHAGEFAAAAALIEEADAVTEATRNPSLNYASLMLAAWRGDEAHALKLIEVDTRKAIATGEGRSLGLSAYATAVLYNGLGRYEAALAGAQRGCDYDDLGFFGWSLVELIEAAARSRARDAAAGALRVLEERSLAAGTEWSLGMLARSRALLSGGGAADALYREAIERLGRSRIVVQLARAHLVYGEWLRRANRRVDAREQLRMAHEMLDGIGAEAFAERARRELLATGETVRKRTTETHELLTAQEAQVARLAAQGHTNPEIGSQLFISPRTAEYHLHKVYTKLGIHSRRELRGALPDSALVTQRSQTLHRK
jgi:DNA-binding CsgD family transcriptional regulator